MDNKIKSSSYKRYISYMYMYKNGIKENNIGFVKLEAKLNDVKLTISINSLEIKNKKIDIYIFCNSHDELSTSKSDKNYIHADEESVIRHDNMNLIKVDSKVCMDAYYASTYRTDISNVFDSGIDFSRTSGVVIMVEDGSCIGTEWGNKEINIAELKQDKLKKALIMNLNQYNESEIIYNDIGVYKDEGNKDKEQKTLENEEMVEIEELQDSQSDKEKSIYYSKEKLLETEEVSSKKNIVTINGQAKKIFANFPGMYPFEDDEIKECVKIEPNDIGLFSMDKWPLASNSFLLHGYYTYRHLIFARMHNKNTFKYILGVPGIFRDRERFMASMFGFKNFKGVRNKPLSNGEFGYWYLEIKL